MSGMLRRDFVKAIVAAPVAAPYLLAETAAPPAPAPTGATAPPPSHPAESLAGADRERLLEPDGMRIAATVPDQFARTEAHYFSDTQYATLTKLCAVMMPALNGYPDALQAGAPEFLDFLIGVSPADRQQMYGSGLDRLNSEAQSRFGVAFAAVDAQQADALLRPWLRAWIPEHPPTEPYEAFINLAHHDIRTATINSQLWSVAATSGGERPPGVGMYWSPIDPDIQRYV